MSRFQASLDTLNRKVDALELEFGGSTAGASARQQEQVVRRQKQKTHNLNNRNDLDPYDQVR